MNPIKLPKAADTKNMTRNLMKAYCNMSNEPENETIKKS